jgi:hypothetical protein
MFLFFYPVDNSQDFGRDHFDFMDPEEAATTLINLKNNGECVPFYDLDNTHPNGRFLNMDDFVVNYNDEDLDGGFWCVKIDISYEKMREIVYGKNWFETGIYPNESVN